MQRESPRDFARQPGQATIEYLVNEILRHRPVPHPARRETEQRIAMLGHPAFRIHTRRRAWCQR
jgi:hypothetical protein